MNDKLFITFLFILFLLCLQQPLKAQFINIELNIEPEISATVEQHLNFGTQVINSGISEISFGDVNMGIFSIKAFYTQNVYLSLEYPEALLHANPAINDQIPLELSLSYNNSGTNDFNRASPLVSNNGLVSIHEETRGITRNEVWQELFLYVYGAIDVGDISNGEYTGDIILTVDYD